MGHAARRGARDADRLSGATSQLAELEARLLTHATTVEAYSDRGATSVAHGLAHTTRVTRREAHGKTRLAAGLEAHPLTRQALARGEVRAEQAAVICRAVDDLATEWPPTWPPTPPATMRRSATSPPTPSCPSGPRSTSSPPPSTTTPRP